MSWRDDTKTIKPLINEVFFASSGDIFTDYNDFYCLFLLSSIPMSAFLIGKNNKQQARLYYTAQNSRLYRQVNKKTYLQAVKRQTVLVKLELPAGVIGYSSRFWR